jgi:hypothetical protein
MLTMVAAPSGHAAALANSTRTLTVAAARFEHDAALAERKMLTVGNRTEDAASLANSTRTLAVEAAPSEHAAALANSTRACHNRDNTIRR